MKIKTKQAYSITNVIVEIVKCFLMSVIFHTGFTVACAGLLVKILIRSHILSNTTYPVLESLHIRNYELQVFYNFSSLLIFYVINSYRQTCCVGGETGIFDFCYKFIIPIPILPVFKCNCTSPPLWL